MPQRRDWAGIWLGAFITSYYQAFMNDLWIEACRQLLERVEQLEEEGREAVMCMGVLVARHGGSVKITRREVEALESVWLRRRTSRAGGYVEFQLTPDGEET